MPIVDYDNIKIKFIPDVQQYEPIPLPNKEGQVLTRKVVKATIINPNPNNPNAPLEISICQQRKNKESKFEDCQSFSLSQLPAGHELRMILDTEQTLALSEILNKLYDHCKNELKIEVNPIFTLEKINEIVRVPPNRKQLIQELVEENHEEEFWRQLEQLKPYTASKLAYARIYNTRNEALKEFYLHLSKDDWTELQWQRFFEDNHWIFGYGLNYKILKSVQAQPHYGAGRVDGTSEQKGDFLQRTEANIKFTVLVEIKTPTAPLLGSKYRNGAFKPGEDLAGGISQLQVNCKSWEIDGSRKDRNREILEKDNIYTKQPKGILVIGNTNQLIDLAKRDTFELLRRNTINPEIITFDELYERAKFIVKNTSQETKKQESKQQNSQDVLINSNTDELAVNF